MSTPDLDPMPLLLHADPLELLQAENAMLRASEAEWRTLVETMPQIVWITRPDGWHVHFNRKWLDFTGLTLEESLGDGWNPPFHRDDRGRAAARWAEATRTGEPYEIEYRLRRADGVYHWMLGRAVPLRDEVGRIVKWFGTCTDIEELKQALARIDEQARLLRERATTDSLTGLGNRALLFDRLDFLLSQRSRPGLAVAFVDLDGFKAVNDEHGHLAGDELLAAVADRLRSTVRPGDVVARLGGDEFVVVAPADDEAAAARIAERLRAAVTGPLRIEGSAGVVEVGVAASVGITHVAPGDPAEAGEIMMRADRAMYAAKAGLAGRRRR